MIRRYQRHPRIMQLDTIRQAAKERASGWYVAIRVSTFRISEVSKHS